MVNEVAIEKSRTFYELVDIVKPDNVLKFFLETFVNGCYVDYWYSGPAYLYFAEDDEDMLIASILKPQHQPG